MIILDEEKTFSTLWIIEVESHLANIDLLFNVFLCSKLLKKFYSHADYMIFTLLLLVHPIS